MADDLTPGQPTIPVTIKLRVRIVYDANGNSPFADDAIVEDDIATASMILAQAGIRVEAESIEPWTADEYFEIADIPERDALREEDWDPGQNHIDTYYVEAIVDSAGWGDKPTRPSGHVICLEDLEEEKEIAGAANWRGIALAHEIGHYLSLTHTHAKEMEDDATHDDGCDDTDIADPLNLMTQGTRDRINVAEDLHLTACQIVKARTALFGQRVNLVADIVTASLG